MYIIIYKLHNNVLFVANYYSTRVRIMNGRYI